MSPASGKSQADRERDEAETRIGWKMAGIGMQVTSEVAAGALLGWLFDYWRGSGHIGVLVGSVCGICVGLYSLIRQSLILNKQLDRVAPTKGRGTPSPPPRETDPLWTEQDDDWTDDDDQPPGPRAPRAHR